jgi:hypothetical protein
MGDQRTIVEYHGESVGVRDADVRVFKACAALRKAYVLVRGTNRDSLQYFCRDGYVPKPFEIKAKTAKRTPPHPGAPGWTIAGLVADPYLVGLAAFGGDVRRYWDESKKVIYSADYDPVTGRPKQPLGGGKHYFVEVRKDHKHYGCLFHSTDGVVRSRYIHGDYDLYDVAPAADLHNNEFVRRPRYGYVAPGVEQQIGTDFQQHLFIDVQTYVNANIGSPVVRHGDQAKFSGEHSDEPVWAFFPDGLWEVLVGRAALREFCRTVLEGRKLEAVQKTFP